MNLIKYLIAASTYGVLHKLRLMHNADVYYYNTIKEEDVKRKLLLTEKLGILCVSPFLSVWSWPIYLFKDMYELETNIRGLDKNIYESDQKVKRNNWRIQNYIFE